VSLLARFCFDEGRCYREVFLLLARTVSLQTHDSLLSRGCRGSGVDVGLNPKPSTLNLTLNCSTFWVRCGCIYALITVCVPQHAYCFALGHSHNAASSTHRNKLQHHVGRVRLLTPVVRVCFKPVQHACVQPVHAATICKLLQPNTKPCHCSRMFSMYVSLLLCLNQQMDQRHVCCNMLMVHMVEATQHGNIHTPSHTHAFCWATHMLLGQDSTQFTAVTGSWTCGRAALWFFWCSIQWKGGGGGGYFLLLARTVRFSLNACEPLSCVTIGQSGMKMHVQVQPAVCYVN
jgi:hypothetical protein